MVNYAASYLTALVERGGSEEYDCIHRFFTSFHKVDNYLFLQKYVSKQILLFTPQKYFSSNDQQSMQLSQSHYTCFSSSSQTKCAVQRTAIAADIAFFTIVVHLLSHPLHERAIKPGNITSTTDVYSKYSAINLIFVG